MITVRLEHIIVPETRFRRSFDEKSLEELKTSILRVGLLNPITVERTSDGHCILRAGERRLRVLKEILDADQSFRVGDYRYDEGKLPVIDYAELTPLQRIEIEVEENVVRKDFVWQERVQALTALHNLRKMQNPDHTLTATASEVLGKPAIRGQQEMISEALIVTKHLNDPDVVKAKSVPEALKVIQKKAAVAHRARLAVTFDAGKTPHTLLLAEAKSALSRLAEKTFDVVVCDPPYGVNADSFGNMASTGHSYEDTKENFDGLLSWLPDELNRVTKPGAHCYIFCDVRRFEQFSILMVLAGWSVFHTPLIWDKCGVGMLPFPDHGPRRTHEYILYAWKGNRKTLMVKNDVLRVPAVKKLLCGAQKPVALYCDLLSRSANPGDKILDCFGGSGPILVAANNMRLVATYIEQDEAAYNIAVARVGVTGFDDGALEDDGIEVAL